MRHRLLWVGMGLLGLGLACGVVEPEPVVSVDECSDGADVDESTLMVWEFEESVHEMITCGSLTFQLLFALLDTAQTLLTDPSGLPAAFQHADGVYTTVGEGVSMSLVFRYGPDTPGGQAGEDIPHNLFDVSSYLVNAEAIKDGEFLVVSFDAPGPLVALLGQGDAPKSPMVLSEADLLVVAANITSVKIKAQIQVDHEVVTSVITYDIDNPAVFVMDALSGQTMNMTLVQAATGERADLNQSLQTTTWDVVYGDVLGTLEGTITAEVRGEPFDYQVRYDYSSLSVTPAVEITCL